MDINKVKLVYSEKVNQFYKPMRIDEDIGVVYVQPTKNKNDDVSKNEIVHMENTDYEYIVMYDDKTNAEDHFLEVMNSNCVGHIKENEVKNFKRNMLMKSNDAMQLLQELSTDKEQGKLYKLAKEQYFKVTNKENIVKNREVKRVDGCTKKSLSKIYFVIILSGRESDGVSSAASESHIHINDIGEIGQI